MTDDHRIAAQIAQLVGERLLGVRAGGEGSPAWAVRQEGDLRAHELIVRELARHRPGDAVLSEEGADGPARLSAERVWIVDPLDGTREFGEPGREDWAVHIALWRRDGGGGDLAAGAVALPAQGVLLSTGGGLAPLPALPERPRILVSRTRPHRVAVGLADALGGALVPMGSAGAKAMAVVRGLADVYAHAGGMYEWDSAAPVAVARAAGLHVSRLDGSPLRYNRANPWLPDLLVCRRELAARVLDFVHAAVGGGAA